MSTYLRASVVRPVRPVALPKLPMSFPFAKVGGVGIPENGPSKMFNIGPPVRTGLLAFCWSSGVESKHLATFSSFGGRRGGAPQERQHPPTDPARWSPKSFFPLLDFSSFSQNDDNLGVLLQHVTWMCANVSLGV